MVDSYNVKEESTNEETDKSMVYKGAIILAGICGIIGGSVAYAIGRSNGLAIGYNNGALDATYKIMKALK